MKKLIIITVTIAALLTGVYYLIGSLIPSRPSFGDQNIPVEVIVTSVKKESINVSKILPARIRSTKTSQVRPQISGIILKKYFKEGSFVKRGEPLYQIDPNPYFIELNQSQSEVNAAKIDLKAKKDNFNRLKKLHKINAISKLHLDDGKTAFEQSKAALAIKQADLNKVKIKLNYTQVLAPIDGKIGRSFVTQGALVKEMQESPLATITNLDHVYADISQSSTKIQEIQDALTSNDEVKVELIMPGLKEKSFKKGILKFSEAIIDESSGSVSLRSEFENKDHKLLPGLFVKAKLNLGKKDVLLIEQSSAIINSDGTMTAFAIDENNIVTIKKITVAGQHKTNWIVTSGLLEGDLVIKEGIQKIRPGSKVVPTMSAEETINMTKKNNKETKELSSEESKSEKSKTESISIKEKVQEINQDSAEKNQQKPLKEALVPKKSLNKANTEGQDPEITKNKESEKEPQTLEAENNDKTPFSIEATILETTQSQNQENPSLEIASNEKQELAQDSAKLHNAKINEFIKNKLSIAQKEELADSAENDKKAPSKNLEKDNVSKEIVKTQTLASKTKQPN